MKAIPDPAELRKLFLLRDDIHFLNHGSFGACPRPVFEKYQALQLELEREPVDFMHPERTWCLRMAEARSALAGFLGARPDDLLMVPNATTGLNIVARSLKLDAGDEVLSTDHEYGALDRTWRILCSRQEAHYVQRPLPEVLDDPAEVVDAVWSGVTDRTRILFLSHITSPTGVRLPVEPLIDRARKQGILTVIDGAHVPGQLDLDLTALDADFYAGNCHKWLMAPKGAAFLHAQPRVQDMVEPLVLSWGAADPPWPVSSPFLSRLEWTGTDDPSAQLSVPEAIRFFHEHDWPAVRKRCGTLLLEARLAVLEVMGMPALCPPDPWLCQMATLPMPEGDPSELGRRLRNEFRVEAPVFEFKGRNWVRISIQGYNTPADIEALTRAVRALRT